MDNIPTNLALWLTCIKADKVEMFDYLDANTKGKDRIPESAIIDLSLNTGSYKVLERWIIRETKKTYGISLFTPYNDSAFQRLGEGVPKVDHPLMRAMLASKIVTKYVLSGVGVFYRTNNYDLENTMRILLDVDYGSLGLASSLIENIYRYDTLKDERGYKLSEVKPFGNFLRSVIDDTLHYIKGDKIELERVIKFDQHKSDIKWVREGEYYMPDHFDYDLNILRKSVTDTDSYAKYLEWLHDPEFVLDELWSDYIEGEKRQKYWLSSCTREGVWSSRKKKVTMNLEHYKLTPAPRKAP